MLLLLGFAFLSGLVTILAPCIWPLLPIILSSSAVNRSRTRPLGITLGIMLSFGVLTLFISYAVRLLHFDPNWLRLLAVIVIGFMGMTLAVPRLSGITESLVSRLSGRLGQKRTSQGSDFKSGFATGIVLGAVWTPCAGPILASIAALATLGMVNLNVILVTAAYVTGIGIPLFILAYSGQQIITSSKFFSKYTGRVQQIFGVVMILTAVAIYTNFDVYLQTQILDAFPVFNSSLANFGSNNAVARQLDILKGRLPSTRTVADPNQVLNADYPAPEIAGISTWLNLSTSQQGLTLQDLKGKVVLIDFWTYSCINCIRTIPFLNSWYEKYQGEGLVIIGVHTPEFQFEHDTGNVLAAIKMFNIHYPVAQDNSYVTWTNYNNQYWPAEYLIDADGIVRRTHFGEGEYDKMEIAIQTLLTDAGKPTSGSLIDAVDQTPKYRISPETYLGSSRMEYYYPGSNIRNGIANHTVTDNPPPERFSLGGEWTVSNQKAVTGNNAVLVYNFLASKVYLVLGPGTAGNQGKVKIFLDGKQISEETIDSNRLYTLVDLPGSPGRHILRLEFENPGIEAYAFTFG
jgi:cytochrome c biogenesis protein CcdA/thiol-disulfide isomerase/thioredoxin